MKTLFFFLILATSLSTNAQITKGNWLVGGSGSFSSIIAESKNSMGEEIETHSSGLQINPNIGYFLADKFVAGLDLGINLANSQGPDNSNWSLGFGPFVRYYFLKPEKLINIFSEANFSYGFGLSEFNKDRNSTGYGLGAGSVLFFNSSVGLEFSVNYTDTVSRDNSDSDSNFKNFFVALGFQIHLEQK